MTLADLARDLPGSLHDASLQSLTIDYSKRRAVFGLSVDIGDPDADNPVERDLFRSAALVISDLAWCIVEPPAAPGVRDGEVWINAGLLSELPQPPRLPPIPDGAFVWWIFVQDWNAFIYVAGSRASLD